MKDRVSWILQQKHLLEKEREAEVEASTNQIENGSIKTLEAKGIALSRLKIEEITTGLFGRPLVILKAKSAPNIDSSLPSHSFTSGDIVGLWNQTDCSQGQITSGVIAKTTSALIHVALDDDSADLSHISHDTLIRLHKLTNTVTYNRIKEGLNSVEEGVSGRSSHLVGVIMGEEPPYSPLPQIPTQLKNGGDDIQLYNRDLNSSQVSAIKFSLCQKDLAVIHGPPGTGKTTTVVEAILQHSKLGSKVLAVAPSNLAVDNLLERLIHFKVSVVRVGHPARATDKAQLRTLDALVQSSDDFQILTDIRNDIKTSILELGKSKNRNKRYKIKEELKIYRKELKTRETRICREILKHCQVVLCTLTSAGDFGPLKLLPPEHFDLVVIDECSQGLECACYPSILKAPKLILAGDHRQLPPTVISPEATSEGFLVSLMERVVDTYKDQVTRMLTTQYRMNEAIMSWASEAMYGGQLMADSSVSNHLLSGLRDVDQTEETETPLCFIDTAGCEFPEVTGEDLSKANEGEAALVAQAVGGLTSAGVSQDLIAVISPYNYQVQLIRKMLKDKYPDVEVRSVDGFQGREKEAVVISLVRSNKQGQIGFLSDDRRLNVAVTRARRHLTIVGDSDTVCRHSFIKSLIDHITERGILRSAHEFELDSIFVSKSSDVDSTVSKKNRSLPLANKSRPSENKPRPVASEEEKKERRIEFEKKIEEFLVSGKTVLEFPPNLNSFERMLVHEIAEGKGLVHESQGQGKDRKIICKKTAEEQGPKSMVDEASKSMVDLGSTSISVSLDTNKNPNLIDASSQSSLVDNKDSQNKDREDFATSHQHESKLVKKLAKKMKNKTQSANTESNMTSELNKTPLPHQNNVKTERNQPNTSKLTPSTKPPSHSTSESPRTQKSSSVVCKICGINCPASNYDMHLLRCERIQKENRIKKQIDKRKTTIMSNVNEDEGKEDDDFKLMERFKKENDSCAYPKCKDKAILLRQLCQYCRNNFCLTHHLAEIHGCGEAAKVFARTVLIKSVKNGVLTPGSGVRSKLPAPAKRSQLERQMAKKMATLTDQRKPKKKEK